MPQPIEAMLARWPLLYPVTTDADEQDGALAATFEEHRGELGDATVKAALELHQTIAEDSQTVDDPHREAWSQESWRQIAHLMTSSELCLDGHSWSTWQPERGVRLTSRPWQGGDLKTP